jgi:putative transposon-encoded protein
MGLEKEMEVTFKAFQVVEKLVKPSGNSGRVYVPKEWIGKRVKIFLIEPINGEEL